MTSEEDFQTALDTNPEDWYTRLVFADWLDERADPRAAGYRALGTVRRRSYVCGFDNESTGRWKDTGWMAVADGGDEEVFTVPQDWFDAIKGLGKDKRYRPLYAARTRKRNRRQIEDAVALAFARLPAARQLELLAPHALKKPRAQRKPKAEAKPRAVKRNGEGGSP
ncbi:MAG: TIGR02996 domain-containing protein [Planctomycetes bacterium]|nr:TIGR02996 domain-containing protein [Planctomycetota bacterium]